MTIIGAAVTEMRMRRASIRPHVALVRAAFLELTFTVAAAGLVLETQGAPAAAGMVEALRRRMADLRARLQAAPEYVTEAMVLATTKLEWEVDRLVRALEGGLKKGEIEGLILKVGEKTRELDAACGRA